jgi:hypothetical protein
VQVVSGPTVGPGIGGTPLVSSGLINGSSGDDWLQGGAGNDVLHGGPGSDYLDGGGGSVNTALYDGVYLQYTVSIGSPTTVSGGPEGGTDDLVNIQRIQFMDGYLATSTTDSAAQVYRIYEGVLGRAPTPMELANWVGQINAGLAGPLTAALSLDSLPSVQALDNTAFVNQLYSNELHRAPSTADLNYWVGELSVNYYSREQVVGIIAGSQEAITDWTAPVQQGLWVGNVAAAEVARMYETVLGRLPDTTGLAYYTWQVEHFVQLPGLQNLPSLASSMLNSAEFNARFGSLNNTDFINLLYSNALHRAPDAVGGAYWQWILDHGGGRIYVAEIISESPEHMAEPAPHIDGGIWITS